MGKRYIVQGAQVVPVDKNVQGETRSSIYLTGLLCRYGTGSKYNKKVGFEIRSKISAFPIIDFEFDGSNERDGVLLNADSP